MQHTIPYYPNKKNFSRFRSRYRRPVRDDSDPSGRTLNHLQSPGRIAATIADIVR